MKRSLKIIMPLLLSAVASLGQGQPPTTKTTEVMVTVAARPGITRDEIRKLAADEVRATLRLYLDGKIRQWYSRSDGTGIILIMNVGSVAEAKALADSLPLSRANLVDHEYVELGPLAPLFNLLNASAPKQ